MFNWVIPMITNYEYKVHIGQGADFTSLEGEYSYKELLNGETKAFIVHFNHTERAEAFYFDYTDSSNARQSSSSLTSPLSLTDTTQTGGSLYMNNVTRHTTLKFDGQAEDTLKFKFIRDECITVGGCNNKNMPGDEEIEEDPRYWSDTRSWQTNKLPVEGEDVIIESSWNMILDIPETPILRSLEINGRLTVQNDGSSYELKSYLIYVRKGELIVGTKDEPFTGTTIFTLHGDRSSLDVYFHDKMFEGGNKVIANTGKVRMYGKPITTKWTRLAAIAKAGATSIEVIGDIRDWAAGDELGIAPSGRDYTHRDFAVIKEIIDQTVTLESALVYDHYGASSVDSTKSGGIDIRAEVLHLTRNIKVQGTNEDRWGAHIVTAHNLDSGFVAGTLITTQRKGHAIIDHVEFVNCSQYDTDHAAVRFADFHTLQSDDPDSSVTNCAIHNGLGIGIMVTSADRVTVDNNVVFFTHFGGIFLRKSHDVTITNNVVAGMGTRYWSNDTRLDEIAGYLI